MVKKRNKQHEAGLKAISEVVSEDKETKQNKPHIIGWNRNVLSNEAGT
jgi:hypothetical protein